MSATAASRLAVPRSLAREPLPRWPHGWYAVATSSALRPGSLTHGALADRPYVLFRTLGGALGALDAHCPHMGAHMRHGKVVGERLRCALHHYHFDRSGEPDRVCHRAAAWEVRESFGLVFLKLGHGSGEPPAPDDSGAFVWGHGSPVEVNADWQAMAINGFDMLHLSAVHARELVEAPSIQVEQGEGRLRLAYTSRVTGRGLSDRVMKWLSGDRIRVRQTCHGTVIVVQTDLGFTQTCAVLGLLPVESGVRAFSAFGVRPGRLAWLRLRIARWLFTAFLRRDFGVVQDMRLSTDVPDPGVRALARFLRSLPREEA